MDEYRLSGLHPFQDRRRVSRRVNHNRVRPHSALGNLTPEEYVGERRVSETDLATFTPDVRP